MTRPAGQEKPDPSGGGRPARPGDLRVTRSLVIPQSELRVRFGPTGGPGGQHANKASTRVELRFDVARSPSLGPLQRSRLLQRLGPEVRVVADSNRSQTRNRDEAVARLRTRIADALRIEKPRTPTRPSRMAVERRLQEKRRRADQKRARRRPPDD